MRYNDVFQRAIIARINGNVFHRVHDGLTGDDVTENHMLAK